MKAKHVYIDVYKENPEKMKNSLEGLSKLKTFVEENRSFWIDNYQSYIKSKDPNTTFIESAVLIPLVMNRNGEFDILLTVRHSTIAIHDGEVCLPGGRCDRKDNHVIETALREASEEIDLKSDNVEVLFEYFQMNTANSKKRKQHMVYPVFGLVKNSFYARLNPDEVEDVLLIPFRDFLTRIQNHPQWSIPCIEQKGITTYKTYRTVGFTYILIVTAAYFYHYDNPLAHLRKEHTKVKFLSTFLGSFLNCKKSKL